jgi:hypothetical protein
MRSFHRRSEGLGFQLVGKLAELVEVNARPETERVRHRLWRPATVDRRRFPEPGADRPIERLLERHAQLARALLQERCQIVVDGQRAWCAWPASWMSRFLMSRHQRQRQRSLNEEGSVQHRRRDHRPAPLPRKASTTSESASARRCTDCGGGSGSLGLGTPLTASRSIHGRDANRASSTAPSAETNCAPTCSSAAQESGMAPGGVISAATGAVKAHVADSPILQRRWAGRRRRSAMPKRAAA